MQDIEQMVCEITLALRKQASTNLNLEAALERLEVDGVSLETELRHALEQRFDDPTGAAEYQPYTQQKLEELSNSKGVAIEGLSSASTPPVARS